MNNCVFCCSKINVDRQKKDLAYPNRPFQPTTLPRPSFARRSAKGGETGIVGGLCRQLSVTTRTSKPFFFPSLSSSVFRRSHFFPSFYIRRSRPRTSNFEVSLFRPLDQPVTSNKFSLDYSLRLNISNYCKR